jgi:DNA-binding FadR family transcriptional regulator
MSLPLPADHTAPARLALMAEFAVSRPTLREAFRVLESESLISIRRARGHRTVRRPGRGEPGDR